MSAKPRCLGHVLLLVPLLILPACQSRSQSDDLQYVELSILEGNGILVEGKQSSLGTLAMTLEQVIDPDWSPVVMRVSCADELPIGRLQAVHRALRSQGLINMSYRTASDDELTLVLPTPDFNERLRELPSEDFATLHIDASGTVTLEGDATATLKSRTRSPTGWTGTITWSFPSTWIPGPPMEISSGYLALQKRPRHRAYT